jgi:hypothetical protein
MVCNADNVDVMKVTDQEILCGYSEVNRIDIGMGDERRQRRRRRTY